MNKQKGLSLTDFLFWAIIIAVVGLIGAILVPSYMEYLTIKKTVNDISHLTGEYKNATEVRQAYDRQANIDGVETVAAKDLEISKAGDRFVIKFDYEKRVKLVGNVSLLIEYQHDTRWNN
jgi:Tfp pilus assembly major pilin PilA